MQNDDTLTDTLAHLVFVYTIIELAHMRRMHLWNRWFSSTQRLGVVPRLLSEICCMTLVVIVYTDLLNTKLPGH